MQKQSVRSSGGRQHSKPKAKVRQDFRRTFLEQLENRQLMAALPIEQTGSTGNFYDKSALMWDGTKVSPLDPRVQAWSTANFVTDSFIVGFQKTVTREEAEQTLATEIPGSSIKTWDDEMHYAAVDLPPGMTRDDVIALGHRFLSLSNTLYAEPNFVLQWDRVPNDPLFVRQWSLNNTQQGYWETSRYPLWYDPFPQAFDFPPRGIYDADIDAVEAWDLTTGSPDVIVAVLDTGMNLFEPIMRPNFWVNPGEIPSNGKDDDHNGVVDDIHGYDAAENDGDPQDLAQNGHGTSVSSIVAAPGDDNIDIAGVSWNSKIMTVKVGDDAANLTTTGIVGGYRYVTKMRRDFHHNIVAANMSFGGYSFSFSQFEALSDMNDANIVMTMSAGNDPNNNDINHHYPSDFEVSNIISVTGSESFDEVYNALTIPQFNYGQQMVDLAAPGIDIMMQGFRFVQSLPFYVFPGPPAPMSPSFPQLFTTTVNSGTSMSAPHVAGVVALAASLAPYLTAAEIKQAILSSVDPIAQMKPITVTGGRLNAFNTLTSIPKTTISGTVFQDANNNKIQDTAEVGMGGWTVYVDLDNDGTFDANEPNAVSAATATTNGPPIGSYSFDAWVDTGTYRVREVLQAGFTQTTPTGNNGAHVITVGTRGQDFANLNFGNRMTPGTIVGRKFLDLDGDGALDTNEGGLPGILFYVDLNNNGRINVGEPGAYTDAQGNFTIPNIQPGAYQVREVITPGYLPTLPSTVGANGLPDPFLPVTVVSNVSNSPALLFGNRVARDWGDLPETVGGSPAYRTTSANGGPSHGILPGFMLGLRQDFEANGQPSATAAGDDLNPTGTGDDEDGLNSIAIVQGSQGVLSLTVTNVGRSPGVIQGWVDFNSDGDFADAGEQILKNFAPANGTNGNIPFTIPAGVVPGVTYARFRYAYERDLGPNGSANAGEVEDYQITIFSALPTARDDRFPEQLFPPPNDPAFLNDPLIKQESTNNVLNVLRNDPPPASGTLTIVPGSFPATTQNGGTLTLSTVGGVQVLLYTPRAGNNPFTGLDEFSYQVTNGTDVSLPARVQVRVTASDPRSVDNTYTFAGNTVGNPPQSYAMDVLANDVNTPSAPISLINFTQPTYPGVTVTGPTVVQNGNNLIITPPAGFVGTVQFQYTITDTDPTTVDSTSVVTVQLTGSPALPLPSSYLASISVEVWDARGNIKGIDPAFRVDVGEAYFVHIFSEDLRAGGDGTNRGVEAAYLDLLYDRRYSEIRFIEVPAGSGNFKPEVYFDDDRDDFLPTYNALLDDQYNFDQNKAGFNSPEGIYHEIGAAHSGPAPIGKGRVPLMVVGLNATAATPAGGTRVTADPAEDSSGRSDIGLAPELADPNYPSPRAATDLQVYLQESPVFEIKAPGAPEFVNLRESLDVNADFKITAFDALSVVNELNKNGARSLREYEMSLGGGAPPNGYVDTNGDGNVSAFDALGIINWLNQHPTAATGAGESTSGGGGEYTGPGSPAAESSGEPLARASSVRSSSAEGSSGAAASSAAGAVVTPSTPPASSGSGSSQTSVTSRSNQTPRPNDSELLYLTAVDALMSQAGEDDSAPSATNENPVSDPLQLGSRLRTLRRLRSGL